MSKTNLSQIAKNIHTKTVRHQPEILTGIGIAGMVTTTVMAVKATPKALDLMAEIKEYHEEDTDKKALAKDVLLKVAPVYIPAVILGTLSVSCLIGANSVNLKRNAALATAYTLSESALKDYRGKVIETLGEKKDQAVRDAIAKDKVDQNPVVDKEVIITNNGETLCLDTLSGRYFKSDIEKLKRAENELNRQMLRDDYISLNEFYDEIGLSNTKIGETVGWGVNKGLLELKFSSTLTLDGKPVLVMDYDVAPYYDYDR